MPLEKEQNHYFKLVFFSILIVLLLFSALLFSFPTVSIQLSLFDFIFIMSTIITLSVVASLFISTYIKNRVKRFEQLEATSLIKERQDIFHVMNEGIIAIDHKLNITIFNEKARTILGVKYSTEQTIGKSIFEILPDTRLPEIVLTKQPVYNQELFINNHSIMSTRIPIQIDGRTLGAIAVFQDLTEFKSLAEELTGVKAFVEALRIQTHEYKNKLHTIAGLIQLGHTSQALDYLAEVQTNHTSLTTFLKERITNEHISGLLLSKVLRGKELGIHVVLDEAFHFTKFPKYLDHHDFVILLGNLIENAFEAMALSTHEEKQLLLSIDDHDDILAILVTDDGVGIEAHALEKIFEQGYSTKGQQNSGIGLFLVNEIVQKGQGAIEVQSEKNKGTTFIITFDL